MAMRSPWRPSLPPRADSLPTNRLSWPRRFLPVWATGVAGVAALLLLPLPVALRAAAPPPADLPEPALRLLLAAQPFVLLTVAAAMGAALSARAGLRSRLAGDPQARLAPGLALAAGALLAASLRLADSLLAPALGPPWQAALREAESTASATTVWVGVLYGGLAEEVMARWGCMAAVMAGVGWIARRPAVPAGEAAPPLQAWCGIVVAALLFAAGHLPALAQVIEPTAPIVARTLALNGAAGLVYGWLCWRRGLECAMLAHAATHLGLAVARWLA